MTKENAEKLSLLYIRIGEELQQSSQLIKEASQLDDPFKELHPTAKVMGSLYFELKAPLYKKFPDLLPEALGGPYKVPDEIQNPGFYNSSIS